MARVSKKSWVGPYWILSLILLQLASWAYALEGPENMDLKALLVQAAQLQNRLDQDPSDYEALRGLGTVYHSMALKDSKAYAKKAVQYLEQAHQKRPDDPVALCYLGSAYTLLAKDAGDRMTQMSYVNKGVEYMDKAARKDADNIPDYITIRLTRANNSMRLPKSLNRRPIAYEDFERLAGSFEKGLKVPLQLKTSVYHSLAALYKEDGDVAKAQKYQTMADVVQKEK